MADVKISEAAADASVSGVELLAVSDAGSPKSVTITNIKDFAIDSIEALVATGSIASTDYVFGMKSGVMKPELLSVVAQVGIDLMWGKAAEATPDAADILLLKDGGTTEKTVTAAVLAEYVRGAIEASILDVSDLSAAGTLADANMLAVTQGTTAKKVILSTHATYVFTKLQTYVTALAAVTVAADADFFYVIQGGVQKKVTRTIFTTGLGTTIAPASTTENKVPQWDSASKTLKDGLTLGTTVRATATAADTYVVTEKAVRDLEKSIINDQTDIDAALADADTFLVDDGGGGTQRKSVLSRLRTWIQASPLIFGSTDIGAAIVDADEILIDDGGLGTTPRKAAMSRVWTWITTKLQALSAKTEPVLSDVLTIQDSEDSSAFKELELSNLKTLFDEATDDSYRLKWVAGQRGKPGLNADIQNAAEATRMVTDPDFELLGTNAVSTDVTFNPEGGIIMETVGADGDEDILLPHLDTNQSAWAQTTWGTDRNVRWECRIKTGSNITNCIIWAGLKLTSTEVTITDADQAFFRYEDDNNDGEWEAVSSIGGSDDEHDTGVVVAVDTDYHLVIDIENDRTAKFYINDTLVETSAALTDAVDLIPYIGVAADGAGAAKSLIVRGQSIRRDFA